LKQAKKMDLLPDSNISRGSCRVESESGTVEFILEQEWERLKKMLLEVADNRKSDSGEEDEVSYGRH